VRHCASNRWDKSTSAGGPFCVHANGEIGTMETRLKRKDIIIIGVVAAVVCLLVTTAIVGPGSSNRPHGQYNFGLGPGWDCRHMYFGGSVCIKRSR
jgi:hypothetical protein